MNPIQELQLRIDEAFSAIRFPSAPADLYTPITYTLGLGGKRLRPLLVLASCQMFGGDIADAINPAIGIELFHNFTLLHDDIMDEAPLRRGKETVYKKWNSNVAILAGDTMFAVANKYMLRTRPHAISPVVELFNQTAIEVCEGQQYDMDYEKQQTVSIPDYIEMIRLKTAVLLAASLKTGAIIAGAETDDCDHIYDFGINIGLAFQLKDDLLDVYGDQVKFGKVSGGDIIAGKKTYLYLKALESAGAQTEYFRELYAAHDLPSNEKVLKVKELFNQLNIEQLTRQLIDDYYQKALHDLSCISLPEEAMEELSDYAAGLMEREN
ncbi:MAG: polyprenyl synthetase family protein [Bacteroidales bacterium]|nr:polyprenyl synthetase family protein [Bacteroidales bacterium]